MTTYIYGLVDPRTHSICYIGQTDDTARRLRKHLSDPGGMRRAGWIDDLISVGLEPQMVTLEIVDDDAAAGLAEQWWNGQKAFGRVHPVLGAGGWAMPAEQLMYVTDQVPQGWTPGELPHKDGNSTPAFLTPEIAVAIIASRFSWVMRGARGPVVVPEYVDGAKGKVQALVAVRGLASATPVMITASGMSGRAFGQVLRAFRQQILAPATALAKRPFPLYAFWMPVRAGAAMNVGQTGKQSPITPPVPAWDQEALMDADKRREILRSLFVGQAVIDLCAGAWQDAQDWAEAVKQQQPAEPNGQDEQELPPPDDDPEIPF